jgi:type VI secretion system protein ImpJ
MEPLRPIRWREGMFVRPHHFQQFDLNLEARQVAYHQALVGNGWGIVRLEIAEELLANYTFEVRTLRAVLPDGTLVDVPGNGRLPGRTIDPKQLDLGTPREILLGVRRVEERRPLALESGPGRGETRFLPVEEEVFDLDVGREPAPIEKMEYDLQLFLDAEPTQGYEVLPIASLSLTGNPAKPLVLTPGFAGPALSLAASPALHAATRSVVERLATVLRKMDDIRGSEKVRELILYQALAGCLPILRDLVRVGNIHPRFCYIEMARLAGTLFYRDQQARSFDEIPDYDHRAPGPVFEKLRTLITELSEPVFAERYRRIPMERDADLFQASVPADVKKAGARVFLEVEAPDSAAKLRLLFMQAKVSNPSRLEHLKQFALPGVATEAQAGPPPELPPGQKGAYFKLKIEDGTEWTTHVVPSGQLTAFLRDCPSDVTIALVVVFPEQR